jgi:hypothetical protein
MTKTLSDYAMEAVAADDAWQRELERVFGERAGDVRYTPRAKGEPGSTLRGLYEEFIRATTAATAAWNKAQG